LANHAVTGDPRTLIRSVFEATGTWNHLRHHYWPYINPQVLDLYESRLNLSAWPCQKDSSLPRLAHLRALQLHYGNAVTQLVYHQIVIDSFENNALYSTSHSLRRTLTRFFANVYVPEMRDRIHHLTLLHLRAEASLAVALRDEEAPAFEAAQARLHDWKDSRHPFAESEYTRIGCLYSLKADMDSLPPPISPRKVTPQQLAIALLDHVFKPSDTQSCDASCSLYPQDCVWPLALAKVLFLAQRGLGLPRNKTHDPQLVAFLRDALRKSGLEVFPGQVEKARFMVKNCVRLVSTSTHEDFSVQRVPVPRSVLPWLQHLPFNRPPDCIISGLDKHMQEFRTNNPPLWEHYHRTLQLVNQGIGNPACQLAILHCIIFHACTVPLHVIHVPRSRPCRYRWDAAKPHSHDPERRAVILLTKIFWFLFPGQYPVKDNNLCMGMTSFIEATGMYALHPEKHLGFRWQRRRRMADGVFQHTGSCPSPSSSSWVGSAPSPNDRAPSSAR
jgi:hypothetical protein